MNILKLCLSDGRGGLELYVDKVARHLAAAGAGSLVVVREGTWLAEQVMEVGITRAICMTVFTNCRFWRLIVHKLHCSL